MRIEKIFLLLYKVNGVSLLMKLLILIITKNNAREGTKPDIIDQQNKKKKLFKKINLKPDETSHDSLTFIASYVDKIRNAILERLIVTIYNDFYRLRASFVIIKCRSDF